MGHRLLFVDDEEKVLASLKRLFMGHDYEIHTAGSGEEALKVVNENPVDLIISDQRMPEMTGVELLGMVREIYPDTIRMILTAYSDIEAAIASINEGQVYKFILKPWENDELRLTVIKALEHYDLIKENKRLNEELKEWNRTLEKKVEYRTKELMEEKNKLITVINTIKEGFVFCDDKGVLIQINPTAEKYFNVKFSEVAGKTLNLDVFTPVKETVEKYLLKFKKDRSQKDCESNFKLNNGEWYNIRFSPVRDSSTDGFLGLIMQIFTIKERYL